MSELAVGDFGGVCPCLFLSRIRAVFQYKDASALQDARMSKLIAYARKVEADFYEQANTRVSLGHSSVLNIHLTFLIIVFEKRCGCLFRPLIGSHFVG